MSSWISPRWKYLNFAIKDDTGRIRARSMMRLLWDGNKPVLMMSRMYPSALNPQLQEALLSFAKKRARELGVTLIGKEVGKGDPFNGIARSLGSPAALRIR